MHMIDQSAGRDAMAYVGEVPWHNLGAKLTEGADLDVWRIEAGLNYSVLHSPVEFARTKFVNGVMSQERASFSNRKVLYRSDTGAPLSVVSKDYRIVQPSTVIEFFRELVKQNGFTMETAGALDDGKRVWALAKVNDGAPIVGHDIVRPYVLLATSYDGTMSTTAKFTTIRVVCHNTLTMSAGYRVGSNASEGQSEKDVTEGAVVQAVRVPHSATFDPKEAKLNLGIVGNAWDRFLVESRLLAATPVNEEFAVAFLKKLLPKPVQSIDGKKIEGRVEDGRAFKRLMEMFKSGAIGSDIPGVRGTAWDLLNTVTEYVDHERGSDDKRLSSAWFGTGEALKSNARDLLVNVAS